MITIGKIFVYSGEDIISSRKAFLEHLHELKEQGFEVVRVQGKDLSQEFVAQNLFSNSLFGNKRALAIENFLSGSKSKEKEELLKTFQEEKENIFFWESKSFSKNDQTKYSSFIFKDFKLPSRLFAFLDNLKPGKQKENLLSFNEVCQDVEAGFVYQMVIRHFRMLILSLDPLATEGLPPWQKNKLLHQSSLFEKDNLFLIYKRLLQIDFEQKTSSSPFSLKSCLELLIAEI